MPMFSNASTDFGQTQRIAENKMIRTIGSSILATLATLAGAPEPSHEVARRDYFVLSERDIRIHAREVRAVKPADARGVPVLCLHGGGGAGVASFDVPVAGYSVAEDLARPARSVRPVARQKAV
jgi:hypothetical protein